MAKGEDGSVTAPMVFNWPEAMLKATAWSVVWFST
jgi:hypothetical protein